MTIDTSLTGSNVGIHEFTMYHYTHSDFAVGGYEWMSAFNITFTITLDH